MDEYNSTRLKSGVKLSDLVKRPELDYFKLKDIDPERPDLSYDVREEVNIKIKYEGYIKQQLNQVSQFKKLESRLLPDDIDYNTIDNLRLEARQKLNILTRLHRSGVQDYRSVPRRYNRPAHLS